MKPIVQTYFDKATFSLTHLVYCPESLDAAIIDPVLDYDPAAVATSSNSAEILLAEISDKNLNLKWVLETHAHADHITAAQWIKQKTDAKTVIGTNIRQVQQTFNDIFELTEDEQGSPQDFDRLVDDGDQLELGKFNIQVMHTPGHTPSCCTYLIGDAAFVGDTIFMPDFGTVRCDFPGGDARQLYQSLQKTLSLPGDTRLFMCHDYMPSGRELKYQTTVAEQKASNIHINDSVTEEAFVKMRTERDAQLAVPKLILPSLQLNIRGGKLPPKGDKGSRFIKLPLNKFG